MKYLLSMVLLLLSFSSSADVAEEVVVDQAFARAAIQQQRNSAAFMKITSPVNASAIVYAKSPVADIVELHTHINDNGVMRMRKINQIDLPTNQMVSLQPGGLHIMLLGLNRDLKPGEKVDVKLGFSDGSEKDLSVPVQMVKMGKMKGMKGHDMSDGKPMKMTH